MGRTRRARAPPADAGPGARPPPPPSRSPGPARGSADVSGRTGGGCAEPLAHRALRGPLPRPGCGARARQPSFIFAPLPPGRSRSSLPFELPAARGSLALSGLRSAPGDASAARPRRRLPLETVPRAGPLPSPAQRAGVGEGAADAPTAEDRRCTCTSSTPKLTPSTPHAAAAASSSGSSGRRTHPAPHPPSAGSGCGSCLDYYFIYFGLCTSLRACSPRLLGPRAPPASAPEPQTPATLASALAEPRQLPRVSAARIL